MLIFGCGSDVPRFAGVGMDDRPEPEKKVDIDLPYDDVPRNRREKKKQRRALLRNSTIVDYIKS